MNENNKMFPINNAHAESNEKIIKNLESSTIGLTNDEVSLRLKKYGKNVLPEAKPRKIIYVFFLQFTNPLIYILIVAAIFSLVIYKFTDAIFISLVLLINAVIGTAQEYSAEKSALALKKLVKTKCRVLREKESYEIDSKDLVIGDIVYLESGDKVPADIRLLNTNNFDVDESLLTGESLAVTKDANIILDKDTSLSSRNNMAFAGTVVNKGRAQGIVVATALQTEIGKIATSVLQEDTAKSPLLIRMQKFTNKISIIILLVAIVIAIIAYMQHMDLHQIFLLAVALVVSAIPEGLPVAITIVLAISTQRMARRNVIVRKLIAVESLGSCTYIATDKTGTLTINKLEVVKLLYPNGLLYNINNNNIEKNKLNNRLARCSVLANEAFLAQRNNKLICHGDSVDIALLKMAYKLGILRELELNLSPEINIIPFESSQQISASLNKSNDKKFIYVKGAFEKILSMCNTMAGEYIDIPIDIKILISQAEELTNEGYRVIALATGETDKNDNEQFSKEDLKNLTFLGFVGIIDPLRKESKEAILRCKNAGINVAMITGDHSNTAFTIAKQLNLTDNSQKVVTGPELLKASNNEEFDSLVKDTNVFARIDPEQKLDIVKSLQRNGHFVAVSGDGANDAPALRAAEVGVAMGKYGTDVAKEAAKLIITDDNFASIVAGVEEGRVAYSNIRKVIFLLISTGVAELILFILALVTASPLPLVPVQLLWLNLVTNGIQDVALACEPAEGNEMQKPPRSSKESIFNKIMIKRVMASALTMGLIAFLLFHYLMLIGFDIEYSRNCTLLLMVLFENIQAFNARSETLSVFKHNIMRNPFLLFGVLGAQLIHIGAMYTPWLKDVLQVNHISIIHWFGLLSIALVLLLVCEIQKFFIRNPR